LFYVVDLTNIAEDKKIMKGHTRVKILYVSSEVVPFAKTGGLADVAGALPAALKDLGHDVRVVMPQYRSVEDKKYGLSTILPEIKVHFQTYTASAEIKASTLPNSEVPIYLIHNNEYFNRNGLYTENGLDYSDNAIRFAFFSMATLWMLRALHWKPEIIVCNDWQTALIPTYLKHHPDLKSDKFYRNIKVLYTIHNLAYQGSFERSTLNSIGLGWEVYKIDGLEFYGEINLMKAGIVFSDEICTVSEKYSKEIQTEEYGCGLDGILSTRKDHITGIINGIDYQIWNPEIDELTASKFSLENMEGKAESKKALQKMNNLPVDKDIHVISMISRMADQKGFDLITEIADEIFNLNVQFVLLGTGDPNYHEIFREIGEKYPDKTGMNITFNNKMAHEIEAGADMFLMPSRYEPCGLNQLYSLKYGTIPIVRNTGGLADSIIDATKKTIADGTGCGFVFEKYEAEALLSAIKRAVKFYHENKKGWMRLRKNAMLKDYSWDASARKYEKLFMKMKRNK
jgi:starch synthase